MFRLDQQEEAATTTTANNATTILQPSSSHTSRENMMGNTERRQRRVVRTDKYTIYKKRPRYPVMDALEQLPDLESEEIDLVVYPEESDVKEMLNGEDTLDVADLTDTENSSFSWSDEEKGFALRDYMETQTVLESLGREERMEHFRAYSFHENHLHGLHHQHYEEELEEQDEVETVAVLESLGREERLEHFRASSAHAQSLRAMQCHDTEDSCHVNEHLGNSAEEYGIEVSRGFFQQLRGVEETFEALKLGLCTEITCLFCEMRLVCIQDCDGVLCPQCQCMSPIEAKPNKAGLHLGGVGVGIFVE